MEILTSKADYYECVLSSDGHFQEDFFKKQSTTDLVKEKLLAFYTSVVFCFWWVLELSSDYMGDKIRKNKKMNKIRRQIKRKIRAIKQYLKQQFGEQKPKKRSSNKYQQSTSFITDTMMSASEEDNEIITSKNYLNNPAKKGEDHVPEPYYQLM